jgi:hypothetical protein
MEVLISQAMKADWFRGPANGDRDQFLCSLRLSHLVPI